MAESCPDGTSLQDTTNCSLITDKADDILLPFARTDDTPILIDRSLFSVNLQSKLEECEGTTSCKYVGFDFDRDTGTRIDNMKYNIDISVIGGSKGVFTKQSTNMYYRFGIFSAYNLGDFSSNRAIEPSLGVVNFGGASVSSTTSLYFSYYDRNEISTSLNQFVPGSTFKIYKTATPQVYVEYRIVSSASSRTSLVVDVTYIGQHAALTFVTGDSIDFSLPGPPTPTMMVAPPGYTYSFDSMSGVPFGSTCSGRNSFIYNGYCRNESTHDFIVAGCLFRCDESGYIPDGWSSDALHDCTTTRYCKKPLDIPSPMPGDILSCKIACDSQATCKGFNFNSVLKQCTLYSDITGYYYNLDTVSFTRSDFPTSEGTLNPDALDSVTYLRNTGNECSKMIECNSNIAQVFDTPGVVSFSTTEIETCGYCPIKTVNKVSADYYVRDEVGRTTKYADKTNALTALQYSDVPNPNTTIRSSLAGLYKITPYTSSTSSRHIFVTSYNQLIYIHGQNSFGGLKTDHRGLQFSFVLHDGTIMEEPPTLTQFGADNKIMSITGNGTTITIETLMPHALSSTSTVFLYGDDLPRSFLNPTIVTGNITNIDNPLSTADDPKPSVKFSFPIPNSYPNKFTGSSSDNAMFFSKVKDRGIPTWDVIPVDYVTNGFQFRTTGTQYLKTNKDNLESLFFKIRDGRPDKYSEDFADTIFMLEKIQTGSQYSVYECPAFSQRNSDCYQYGEKTRGHTWFLKPGYCFSAPTINRWSGTPTCAGMCNTGCPDGFRKYIADDIGCLDMILDTYIACRYESGPTVRTVTTPYDMIFEMITGSGCYEYPENMILQSLTGKKYLLKDKKLHKIKNSIMYYYVIKNSGTDNWHTLVVPSQEMIDEMPKGPDVTVEQDTGPADDDDNYFFNVTALNVNPSRSENYDNLTQRAWLTQILACSSDSYSTEGIKPCTACPPNSTSTEDRMACVCADSMYFWNYMTNTCDLKGCTGNKYNLVNGKEPCTECVSGSTVNPTHTACVCPVVANGTNTWQRRTNTCVLVCNTGYTAYGNRCIDDFPKSIAQAALDLERQRVQFAFTPPSATPPPPATNADIQNALKLEMHRVMYSLRNTGPTVGDITTSVQTGLNLEKERVMYSLRNTGPTVGDIMTIVQSQLNIMALGSTKYSVPCKLDAGYYSSTGFEPCSRCRTCPTDTTSSTYSLGGTCVSTPSPNAGSCTRTCRNGYTNNAGGTACECATGKYIDSSSVCAACTTCPPNTTSSTYSLGGTCVSTPSPNAGSCTRTCVNGYTDDGSACVCATGKYINSSSVCTACTTCPTDTTSSTYSLGGTCVSTPSPNAGSCTRTCVNGYTNNAAVTACECATGKYINSSSVCAACTTCPPNTTSTTYSLTGCTATSGPGACNRTCENGYTDLNGSCTPNPPTCTTGGCPQWVARAGSTTGIDTGYGVAVSGTDVYITGKYSGSCKFYNPDGTEFATLPAISGYSDIFLAKYNLTGTVQWVTRAGSVSASAGSVGYGVAVSGTDVYITGSYNGTCTFYNSSGSPFATTLTEIGINSTFLAKYNSSGAVQFVARAGSASNSYGSGNGVAVSGADVYITGQYGYATCTFYNSSGSAFATTLAAIGGPSDIFLAKYNSSGNVQWVARAGSTNGSDIGRGVAVSGTDVYIIGHYSGSCTFYNSNGTALSIPLAAPIVGSGSDMFLAKYNSSGTIQWVARAASIGTDIGYGVAVSGADVYITGQYRGTCTFYNSTYTSIGTAFATTLAAIGSADIFLAKYNSSGAVQWVARAGSAGWVAQTVSTGNDIGYGVAVSGTDVYITGQYSGSCKFYNASGTAFATTLAAIGGSDMFLAKYNSSGTVQSVARAGSAGDDIGYGIAASGTDVYITGQYSGTCTFYDASGPAFATTLAAIGGSDMFLAKYNSGGADPCPGGYVTGGVCTPCPSCTTTIANATATSTCSSSGVGMCTVACNSGFTPSPSTGPITSCTCPSGKYITAAGVCTACRTCPTDTTSSTYSLGGTCVSTPSPNAGSCTRTCRNGYTNNAAGTACVCATGKYIDSSSVCTACTTCPANTSSSTYSLGGTCVSTPTPSAGSCTRTCENGYTDDGSACVCATGKYITASGMCTACTTCPTDTTSSTYSLGGTCVSTPSPNAGSCTRTCVNGYTNNAAVTACECATGKYINSSSVCTACTTCSPNTSSTTYSLTGCTSTPTPSAGSCTRTCENGYTNNAAGTACECATGKYINSFFECTACTTCPTVTYASTQLTRTGCGGSSAGSCTGLVCKTGFTNTGSDCTCPAGKYIASRWETVIMQILVSCDTCAACPANQTRVGCTGTDAGTCVNDCVYTWSTGSCTATCGGYQIVSPTITQYAASNSPKQCPTPYAQACSSSDCYLYLYSGENLNGNRRAKIGPIYGPGFRVFSDVNTIVRGNDLRSMWIPSGLNVSLYSDPNYTVGMGAYGLAYDNWAGRPQQWDEAESLMWYFATNVPNRVVAPTNNICPHGMSLVKNWCVGTFSSTTDPGIPGGGIIVG
jgi:hypothetical protein